MAKTTYNTNARQRLLSFFERNPDRHFTAEELGDVFSVHVQEGSPIAKSTLYRQLCALCREGLLQSFHGTDAHSGATVRCYQANAASGARDCRNHFHLKCTECGALQHLECDKTALLLAHLSEAHRFAVDCGKSILYGICAQCAEATDAAERSPIDRDACPCGCGKPRHRAPNYSMTAHPQTTKESV